MRFLLFNTIYIYFNHKQTYLYEIDIFFNMQAKFLQLYNWLNLNVFWICIHIHAYEIRIHILREPFALFNAILQIKLINKPSSAINKMCTSKAMCLLDFGFIHQNVHKRAIMIWPTGLARQTCRAELFSRGFWRKKHIDQLPLQTKHAHSHSQTIYCLCTTFDPRNTCLEVGQIYNI